MSVRNLDFSNEIELSDGQYESIVLDIPKGGLNSQMTYLCNYGTKIADNIQTLKLGYVEFGTTERDYTRIENAQLVKTVGGLSNYFMYSMKTFPHFGAYGFVNYNNPSSEQDEKRAIIYFGDEINSIRGENVLNEIE